MKRILGQNLIITIISKTLSFVAAFYVIKILSKEDYAMYNRLLVMLTFLPYFEIAITRGFFIEYPKLLHSGNKKDGEQLFLNYSIFIVVIYLILGSFIFINNIPQSISFCGIVFGQFLFSKFIEVAFTYYNSHLKMQQMINIKYVTDIVTPLCTIALLFVFQKAWSVFAAQTIVYAFIIVFLILKNKIHLSPLHFEWNNFSKNIRFLFAAGLLIHITGWLDIALLNCDKIFMTSMVSNAETTADYCFAWNIANFVFIIGASIVGPYSQYLFKEIAGHNFEAAKLLIQKLNKQLIWLMGICIIGALVCFPVLIGFKSYEKYNTTYPVFALLIFGNAAFAFMGIYKYYINSMKLNLWMLGYELVLIIVAAIAFFSLQNLGFPLYYFAIVYVFIQLTFFVGLYLKVNRSLAAEMPRFALHDHTRV